MCLSKEYKIALAELTSPPDSTQPSKPPTLSLKLRDVQQECEVAIFKQVFIKKYKASLNLDKISRNMLLVMRIE